MMIEITSVSLNQGVVNIFAIDVSEENLQRLERTRDDGFEQEVEFVFDTHQKEHFLYLNRWLRKQKATKGCSTWGEALHSILGTITTISAKYRNWE